MVCLSASFILVYSSLSWHFHFRLSYVHLPLYFGMVMVAKCKYSKGAVKNEANCLTRLLCSCLRIQVWSHCIERIDVLIFRVYTSLSDLHHVFMKICSIASSYSVYLWQFERLSKLSSCIWRFSSSIKCLFQVIGLLKESRSRNRRDSC